MKVDIPISLLPGQFAVCRLSANAPSPDWARPGSLLAYIHTPEEFSVVCQECYVPTEVKAERGWRTLKVHGPLDFSLVGVLASLTAVLAEASVSVFVLSTYETDYVLVKEKQLEQAVQALRQAGYTVHEST
jgi:uncharacterized protein